MLIGTIAVFACLFLLWLLSLHKKDAGIIDAFWGMGFVIIAWAALLELPSKSPRGWVIAGLLSLWGARLSIYLWSRNHGKGEDRRYAAMRASWGERFGWISLITVFMLQGVLIALLSYALAAAIQSPAPWGMLDILACSVFALGFLFESIGDYQLSKFTGQKENQGRVMDRGLWRYTRHPNYFGDSLLWWGLGLFAIAAQRYWALYAPALMTLLLLRVSGVALLEKTIGTRRPDYERYMRTTSAFIPWFPKKEKVSPKES